MSQGPARSYADVRPLLIAASNELAHLAEQDAPALMPPVVDGLLALVCDYASDRHVRMSVAFALAAAVRARAAHAFAALATLLDVRPYVDDPLDARIGFLSAVDAARERDAPPHFWTTLEALVAATENRTRPREPRDDAPPVQASRFAAGLSERERALVERDDDYPYPPLTPDARYNSRLRQLVIDYYGTLRSAPDTVFEEQTQARALADYADAITEARDQATNVLPPSLPMFERHDARPSVASDAGVEALARAGASASEAGEVDAETGAAEAMAEADAAMNAGAAAAAAATATADAALAADVAGEGRQRAVSVAEAARPPRAYPARQRSRSAFFSMCGKCGEYHQALTSCTAYARAQRLANMR